MVNPLKDPIFQDYFNAAKDVTRTLPQLPHILNNMAHRNVASFSHQSGLEFLGMTTPKFRRDMIKTYASLPQETRDYLHDQGSKIVICGVISDVNPAYNERYYKPRQEDGRITKTKYLEAILPNLRRPLLPNISKLFINGRP